jgi:hypothetical protein
MAAATAFGIIERAGVLAGLPLTGLKRKSRANKGIIQAGQTFYIKA